MKKKLFLMLTPKSPEGDFVAVKLFNRMFLKVLFRGFRGKAPFRGVGVLLLMGSLATAGCFAQTKPAVLNGARAFSNWQVFDNYGGPVFGFNGEPPFRVWTSTTVNTAPIDIKYSLYTYKSTFYQDNKRNVLQGIEECGCSNPLTTQNDINTKLDKIYELDVTENTAAPDIQKEFDWDGYTDPKFTGGKRYPVRDCIFVGAHDKDGNFLGLSVPTNEGIERLAGVTHVNYIPNEKTISADIYYALNRPVKDMLVLLGIDGSTCVRSNIPYSAVNTSAEAMITSAFNAASTYHVIAYTKLAPLVADGQLHTIRWENITKINWADPIWKSNLPAGNFPGTNTPYYQPIPYLDGTDFIPQKSEYYILLVFLETDDMTFTGIKDGAMTYANPYPYNGTVWSEIPPPTGISAIPNIKNDSGRFSITLTPAGYKIECAGGASVSKTQVSDILGRTVLQQNFNPPATSEVEVPVHLDRNSIYIIRAEGADGTTTVKVKAEK